MPNQLLLNKLKETAKSSKVFSGFSEADLQTACASFADRSDDDVAKAIENLEKENERLNKEEEDKKKAVQNSQEKLIEMHQEELIEQKKDSAEAEQLLKKLFE